MMLRRLLPTLTGLILLSPLVFAGSVPMAASSPSDPATRIEGIWPTGCQPSIRSERSTPDGSLDILLRKDPGDCAGGPHRFSLMLPARDSFSPALPAEQVVPVHLYAERAGSTPELLGFGLRGGDGSTVRPDSGFWWPQGDQAASGNVLSLELQGDALGIALLSHDDVSGKPVWYFGTSRLSGKTAHARLSRLDDGSSPFFGFSVQPTPHPGWTIDIAFESGTSARVWLSRPSPVQEGRLELASMHFARRSFAVGSRQQQWLGSWLVARDLADNQAPTAQLIPARLRFTASQTLNRRQNRLIGAQGDFALDCNHDAQTSATPRRCVLRDATGAVLARFDQVGLERMDGEDSQGHSIVLLRSR